MLPPAASDARGAERLASRHCAVLRDTTLALGSTQPPLPLRLPVVEYPAEIAQHAHTTDSARVRVVVDRDGRVPACAVTVESISDSLLLAFVPPSAATLRFRPATRDDEAVPVWLTMTLFFSSAERVRAATDATMTIVVDQLAHLLPGAPTPSYPQALKATHLSGSVVIGATVTTEGRIDPESVRIVSSDHPLFTEAVTAVLPRFRFEPARRGPGGPPVASVIQMPFDFDAP